MINTEEFSERKESIMQNNYVLQKKDPFIKWVLLVIPVLFIVATPLHFSFQWTGKNIFIVCYPRE
jgi:hypothetical protein